MTLPRSALLLATVHDWWEPLSSLLQLLWLAAASAYAVARQRRSEHALRVHANALDSHLKVPGTE